MTEQDPKIIDVVPPTKLASGGFVWQIRFELPMPAARNGWIVQEMFKSIEHSQGGDPHRPTVNFHFWEAWPVQRGFKEIMDPNYRRAERGVSHPYNDIFGERSPSNSIPRFSAGEITVQATARFYEVELPSDFVKQLPTSLALALPSTFRKPSFWGGSGSFRYLYYAWAFDPTTGGPSHPVLRTAAKSNAKVFVGSIQKPAGTRTWP